MVLPSHLLVLLLLLVAVATNLKYSDQPTKALTCGDAEDKAREMHAAFLRAYPEIDPAAFPLQRLRTDNWERPFENA